MKSVKNQNSASVAIKKYEARMLYVVKKLTAKEISSIVDVTEKSLGVWIKKYKWKDDRDKPLNGNIAVDEFIRFLQVKHPMLSQQYKVYANEYYEHQKLISPK